MCICEFSQDLANYNVYCGSHFKKWNRVILIYGISFHRESNEASILTF